MINIKFLNDCPYRKYGLDLLLVDLSYSDGFFFCVKVLGLGFYISWDKHYD